MRVAIDVTPMVGGPDGVRTGIGQTVAALMDVLPSLAADRDIEVAPYCLSFRARHARVNLPAGTRFVPVPARLLLPAWARTGHPRIDSFIGRPDVVHATNYLTPPTRRAVVWVHDVAFLRDPSLGSADAAAYGTTLRRAARRGALLVTGAHAIADDIRDALGDDVGPGCEVAVVPLALPNLPEPTPVRVGPDAPFILALGTCEPRKNLPRLVTAFTQVALKLPDIRLVLAGPPGTDTPKVEAAINSLPGDVRKRVDSVGPVSDRDRVALLRDATVLAYPSLTEGFGLPMLEAMANATPVVAGDVGSIPEVAGDAAVLVDPLDVDGLADALIRIADDAALRADLIGRGMSQAAQFTPERMAEGLIACYQRVLA